MNPADLNGAAGQVPDPRKSHPIPPMEDGPVRKMKDIPLFIPAGGYGIAEWHSNPDASGKPEALLLRLLLEGPLDGSEVIMRIKSREETNRLIKLLERHRDNVWPLVQA